MNVCRACNDTRESLVALDEALIVALLDGLSQLICQTCLDMINLFIEFRKKSLITELKLRAQIDELQQVKVEVTIQKESREFDKCPNILKQGVIIKPEIKKEILDEEFLDEIFDDEIIHGYDFGDLEPLINNLNVEGIKKDQTSKKKRKARRTKQSKVPILSFGRSNAPNESSLLTCGLCKKSFNKDEKETLQMHLESHKDDAHCQLCQELFTSWPDIVSHRFNHVESADRRCHICSKRFQKPQYYEFHFRKVHCKEENIQMTCKVCGNNYPSPRKLQKHHWWSHSEKRYMCDFCSKPFTTKGRLAAHIKMKHCDAKTFSCPSCEYSCKLSINLKDHIIRKHTATKLYCKQCTRVFMDQEKFDKHNCKGQCICPVCGETIPSGKKLHRHMKKHSAEKPYRCTLCDAAYRTRQNLAIHRDAKHGGERRYRCQYCPRAFYSQNVLIKHRRTHTGEKPYVCPECHKGFTGNNNLKVHMKVHGIHNLIVKRVKPEEEA